MGKERGRARRVAVRFARPLTIYRAGEGCAREWQIVTARVGEDENGSPLTTDVFYCEWTGAYGATAIEQEANGVHMPARVRLPFVKALYDALTTRDVRIYKGGVMDEAHAYELASAVIDPTERGKILEFQVKKREVL